MNNAINIANQQVEEVKKKAADSVPLKEDQKALLFLDQKQQFWGETLRLISFVIGIVVGYFWYDSIKSALTKGEVGYLPTTRLVLFTLFITFTAVVINWLILKFYSNITKNLMKRNFF